MTWADAQSCARVFLGGYMQAYIDHRTGQLLIKAVQSRLQAIGKTWEDYKPWFSHDNNKVQQHADHRFIWRDSPLKHGQPYDMAECRLPLAPNSPDCHKVVEHVFCRLSHSLYTELYRDDFKLQSAADIGTFLREQFFNMSVDSIRQDVDKLPKLYRWLVDHGGRWAPRKMR